jgi:hypothetical protein
MTGWAIDPDAAGPIDVDLYVNGVMAGRVHASAARPDVGGAYPPWGDRHGFDVSLGSTGGLVCAYAINVGPGGGNPLLGCRNVIGSNPIGSLDIVSSQNGAIRVAGWTLDGDADGPIAVDFYLNGGMLARLTAAGNRPDVAAAYPAWGPLHGYDVSIPTPRGTVCVYAINVGPGTSNPLLGCRSV